MAETLTYDPTPAEPEVLNADEQDSLQVGEKMQEEQESLLAGKYKNAEELEKAYTELEKKLGEQGEATEEPKAEEEPKEEEESKEDTKEDKTESNILDTLWEQTQAGEKFSDEALEELSKTDPATLAKMHLEQRSNNVPEGNKDFSEGDVKELKAIVGGDENYSNMLEWAQQNLQKQEVDMFDTVMERGDPLSAFFAVRSLAYRYNDAIGYDGKMVTGTAPKEGGDEFRSQAEVVEAMSDPRYDRDSAYRRDVMNKLKRSNVNF